MNFLLSIALLVLFKTQPLAVRCPDFNERGKIPEKYTCEGENISPEITVGNIPGGAKTLAIIVEDPDAASGTFDHWIMWNVPVGVKIAANTAPGVQGKNGKKENKDYGPCPPSGKAHHYHFKVYALDQELDLSAASGKQGLMKAMEGHVLAAGETVGTFKRPK